MEIKKTNDIVPTSLTALIVGQPSVGKTTLASTLPETLIVSCESGLLSLKNYKVDYIEINNIKTLTESLLFAKDSKYKNIYFD